MMLRGWLTLLLGLACTACMPTRQQVREALVDVAPRQATALSCARDDRCALPSPLRALGEQHLDAIPARHRVVTLESGEDALLARIHLIRAARESIELQAFIFAEDDAGQLVLQELLAAAKRGVRVRVLLDQLFSPDDVDRLAELALAHRGFELRLYNPTFGEASTDKLQFLAGILCCFTRFNQRMHNKLLLVDGMLAITGGRNVENRYFDWDPQFNYRDRDILVVGPVVHEMLRSFDTFWQHRLSVPLAALRDVRRVLRRGPPQAEPPPPIQRGNSMLDISAQADSWRLIERRLVAPGLDVHKVEFLSDLPNKPFSRQQRNQRRDLSARLRGLLSEAQQRVLLQTPYLVFSDAAQAQFRALRRRPQPPQIIVSTNSLAATDAFPVYALSHKYKRRYVREFGFQIYEYKPYPASAPVNPAASGALDAKALRAWRSESRRNFGGSGRAARRGPLPLRQAGMRIGLHAKSLVIDEAVGMIGTHNFDPRSDRLNTESVVLVRDAAFARQLARTILRDTLPENSWVIARRPRPPVLSGLNYQLGKVSERLPLFDLWPWRYATSWDMLPGCSPLPPSHPRFAECYRPVGDFPEVALFGKSLYTRILTAFGAGLAPIL